MRHPVLESIPGPPLGPVTVTGRAVAAAAGPEPCSESVSPTRAVDSVALVAAGSPPEHGGAGGP